MNTQNISKNALMIIFLIVLMVSLPVAAMAADMPGMDQEQGEMEAVEPGDPGYVPVEEPADDSTMAMIAAGVFGLPVLGWLIFRSAKKGKKKAK